MELSFSEVVILAAVGRTPKSKKALAADAARLYQSTKFDAAVALREIAELVNRRLLLTPSTETVALSHAGWAALLQALPVLESVRAAIGGATPYRPVSQ